MAFDYEYPQRLNLDNYDVFLEQPLNDTSYIFIDKLPHILTYGKHFGTLSWRSPANSQYQIKNGSQILFELKDKKGNIIKTDLSNTLPVNGAAVFYTWIEKNPLYLLSDKQELADGPCILTVVYELENVPDKWKGTYNGRSTFQFELQKDLPNTSPILFRSASLVSSSFSISESIELDSTYTDVAKPNAATEYKRSVLHISTSNLLTEGGKVDSIEVLYNENLENPIEYKLLTVYPISSSDEYFEVSSSYADGLNPLSYIQKISTPRNIRRNQDVVFKLRFLNSNQEVARKLADNTEIAISTSVNVTGSPLIVENEDFLVVSGSGGIIFGEDEKNGLKLFPSSSIDDIGKLRLDLAIDSVVSGDKDETVFTFNKDDGKSIKFAGDDVKVSEASSSAAIGAEQSGIISSSIAFISATSASVISSSNVSAIIASVGSDITDAGKSPNQTGITETNAIIAAHGSGISGSAQSIIFGNANHITSSDYSCIIGGSNCEIYQNVFDEGPYAGSGNIIIGGSGAQILGGGAAGNQVIQLNTIINGFGNKIITSGSGRDLNIIGGGGLNEINSNQAASIIGGYQNKVSDTNYSSIIGGYQNQISGSSHAAIIGGGNNWLSGSGNTGSVIIGMVGKSGSQANTVYVQNLGVDGNMTISGTLHAHEFHTLHTSSSIIYKSGSTQFGDSDDDTHTFIGHITASGNVSSSGDLSVFGEVVHLEGTDPRLKLKAKGANHPGIEWYEDSTRKWILYSDPDSSQGGNDNLTWKNASDTELMELDQDGMLYVSSKIVHLDDVNTFINFTDDDINFQAGGQNMIDLTSGSQSEITFNEAGIDIDFRVEGDSDTKLLFTDAGNDRVGIGTNEPTKKLQVSGSISGSELFLYSNDNPLITLERNSDQNVGIQFINTNGTMIAGIDEDLRNTGANVFGIGQYGDIIDNDGQNHATFVVTGSQVVINNATSASSGIALTVSESIQVEGNISASGNIFAVGDISASGDLVVDGKITASSGVETTFITASGGYYGQVLTAAQTNINSLLATDIVIGEDAQTQIDFETVNEIHFDVNNAELVNMTGNQVSGSIISTGSFGSVVIDGADTAVLEIQGDVSSSITGTGSFGKVTLKDSGSALDFIGHITGSSLSTGSFGRLELAGDISAGTGSLSSISLTESGSALTIQGNLTGSSLSTASIGVLHTPSLGVGNLNPTTALTVEGDISASANLFIQGDSSLTGYTKIGKNVAGGIDGIAVEGDITASGDLFIGVASTSETVATFEHPATGSLMKIKATNDSGSIHLSGSLRLNNSSHQPSDSGSKLYQYDNSLYWSGNAHIPNFQIAPKVRQYYHHNFFDDPGTNTVYLPWSSAQEWSSGLGSGAQLFVCDAKLLKMFFTVDDSTGTATITMELSHRNPASDTDTAIGTKTFDIDTNSDRDVILIDWTTGLASGTNTVTAGDLVNINMDSSADVSGNEYYNITTVWELDYSTELTASITS